MMQCNDTLVAVDTNVLMGKLHVLKGLSHIFEDIGMALFVPKTVSRELDRLKTDNASAREALHFIEQETARSNRKVFMEPFVEETGSTNDDSIVISCWNNRIPILLSDDKAMRLKANSAEEKGLVSISVGGKTAAELFDEMAQLLGMHFMECDMKEDDFVGDIKKMTARAAFLIYHRRVLPTVERELGKDLAQFYLPEGLEHSLSSLLEYVLKNHQLFRGMLSNASIKIITKLHKKCVTEQEIALLLDVFGVSFGG
ncbi:uncharacterized protein NEMAJ01_0445 [Nematocida major]|uniref:uncharacterized protein n=1 Tax=Nematocida major TaxID=1912982 RepID=UPI0020075A9D|nr:uncharacterized protein NEMAJ01_0445 [Nematocida major]KAH9385549.1 hypothetical protein NEMAJ01_0445 [Nematocida major]